MELMAQLTAAHSLPLHLRQETGADVRSVLWADSLFPHGSPPRTTTSTAHMDLDSRDPCALWDLPQYPTEQLCKAESLQPGVTPSLLLEQTPRNHHLKESQYPGNSILFHAQGNAPYSLHEAHPGEKLGCLWGISLKLPRLSLSPLPGARDALSPLPGAVDFLSPLPGAVDPRSPLTGALSPVPTQWCHGSPVPTSWCPVPCPHSLVPCPLCPHSLVPWTLCPHSLVPGTSVPTPWCRGPPVPTPWCLSPVPTHWCRAPPPR